MSSLMPKGRYITAVLIGPTIDQSDPMEHLDIIKTFLDLPHIKRLVPRASTLRPSCICCPNMTIGPSRQPYGSGFAAVGDLAVSRLYKDGIFSAYSTASRLANSILHAGIDKKSLKKTYWPVVRDFTIDNRFGNLVFGLNRSVFRRPLLSRVLYQAVLTERRTRVRQDRRLENILWRFSSGDDSYKNIFLAMLHPVTIWQILIGGLFITGRNYLVERLLKLDWQDVGRYPTGTYREALTAKRRELTESSALVLADGPSDFEKMYSIKIRAAKGVIMDQLSKFGEADCKYFTSNVIRVRKAVGSGNERGSIIEYSTPLKLLDFSVILETVLENRYLTYRVRDGFARDGALVFDVRQIQSGVCLLSIYVAFDFPGAKTALLRWAWNGFKLLFPGFVHDVLWNNALCRLKDVAENYGEA